MRERIFRAVALIAGIAVAIVGWLVFSSGPSPSGRPETGAAASRGVEVADMPVAPPALPPEPASTIAEEGPGSNRRVVFPESERRRTSFVRGWVVMRSDGRAVAGAIVALRTGRPDFDYPSQVEALGADGVDRGPLWWPASPRLWKAGFRLSPELRGVSGEDGAFEIAVPPEIPPFHATVEADFAMLPRSERKHVLDSPEVQAGIRLELRAAGNVEGTVAGLDGTGATGAWVVLESETPVRGAPFPWRTGIAPDAMGRFRFRGIHPGSYTAAVLADGFAAGRRAGVGVESGETTRLEIQLERESFVSGRVEHASGAPVDGGFVQLVPEDETNSWLYVLPAFGWEETSQDGSFRVGGLPAGRYRLSVGADGMISPKAETIEVPEGAGVAGIRLVLTPGTHRLAGRVVDAAGTPIPGARVRAVTEFKFDEEPTSFTRRRVETREDGRFAIEGIGPDLLRIRAEKDGLGSVELRNVRPGSAGLEVVLGARTGFEGVVRDDATGAPVPRFTVATEFVLETGPDGRKKTSTSGPRHDFASPTGSFEVTDLWAGRWEIRVTAEGFLPGEVPARDLSAGEMARGLEVRLQRPVVLRGSVVEGPSGSPIEGATIVPWAGEEAGSRRSDARWRTVSGAKGEFEVANMPPGKAFLEASHERFGEVRSESFEARAGETLEGITVVFSQPGGVEGVAANAHGAPRVGWSVTASSTRSTGFPEPKTSETDAEGRFRIEGLVPGEYFVVVADEAGGADSFGPAGPPLRATVEVEAGRIARVEFARPTGCRVVGRVTRGGTPVSRAIVILNLVRPDEHPGVTWSRAQDPWGWTGEDGAYAIEGVPPGEALVAVRGGENSHPKAVPTDVPDASEWRVDIDLPGGILEGRVVDAASGEPVSGALIEIQPAGSSLARVRIFGSVATTSEDGRFRLQDLAPGSYYVRAGVGAGNPIYESPFAEERPRARDVATETKGPVAVGEGGPAVVEFRLSRAATALVTVTGPAGEPVRFGHVTLHRVGLSEDDRRAFQEEGGSSSDEAGIARVRGVAPGLYYVRAICDGFPAAFSEERELRAGEEVSFSVRFRVGVRVRIRVGGDGGEPLSRVVSRFVDGEGRESYALPSRADAEEKEMAVARLVPGAYLLVVEAEGYREATRQVHIGATSPQDLLVRLERNE